jgi:hypothetical protein
VSEKDEDKFKEITEVAKLSGIKFVSRNDSRTPLSAVTHFIFYDLASANRRRDLLPLAQRTSKFVVSFEWLKDTFLAGQIREEGSYDMAETFQAPAVCGSPEAGICPSVFSDTTIAIKGPDIDQILKLVTDLGATPEIYTEENHKCRGQILISQLPVMCACVTTTDAWLHECYKQKRFLSPDLFRTATQHAHDTGMENISVSWGNRKAEDLANSLASIP